MSYCDSCGCDADSLECELEECETELYDFRESVRTDLIEKIVAKLEEHPVLGKTYNSLHAIDRRFFVDSIKDEIERL